MRLRFKQCHIKKGRTVPYLHSNNGEEEEDNLIGSDVLIFNPPPSLIIYHDFIFVSLEKKREMNPRPVSGIIS